MLPTVNAATPSARGAVCEVTGAATISPGLTTSAKSQTVTLTNVKLTNCYSGSTAAAGVPKATHGSVSVPAITTKASCASGNLNFTAAISWADGTTTSAKVSTTGVLVNQVIKGTVTSSTNKSLKSGDTVAGNADFQPAPASQNCATVPVKKVTFTGVLGVGAP
jgi:hypothetical protein